ncbi:MAG TPA: 2Fe-2S iron-sulfur cluster-binding protein [Ktedonobacterales bacterium]
MASTMPQARRPAAREGMIGVQVVACTPAAHEVVTLALALPGTQRAPAAYLPGQFITLEFATAQRTFYRSYSLCGDGRVEAPWEITVKRHHAGLISRHLYDRVRPGMLLRASLPQGGFTLPAPLRPDQPIVFVAGGSGIAPIYGMLRALARLAPALRPRVWLHYAYHSPADAIYGRELAALDPRRQWLTQWHYIATNGYRLRPEQTLAPLGAAIGEAEWYVCGPEALKRGIETAALRQGVPAARIHGEVFASPATAGDTVSATASSAGGRRPRVRLADSGAVLTAAPGATLLETLERAGYHPDFSCRAGACGTCRLRLVAGQVRNGDGSGLTPAERAAGDVLSCVARPVGDVTLASAGVPGGQGGGRHRPGQRALRIGLTAAAAALFVAAWGFTNHSPVTAASSAGASSNSAAPSDSNSSPSILGGSDNSGASGQNPFGSGSFSSQSGSTVPNTSTGVS